MLAGIKNARGRPDVLARLTVLVWTLLLFFGSLTSYSGFPHRFERDLGVPLALLAALTLVTLVTLVRPSPRSGGGRAYVAALLAFALTVTLVGAQSVLSLERAAGPSARPKDRPAPPNVAAAGTLARAAQRRRKHSRDPVPEARPEPGHAGDGRVHKDAVVR